VFHRSGTISFAFINSNLGVINNGKHETNNGLWQTQKEYRCPDGFTTYECVCKIRELKIESRGRVPIRFRKRFIQDWLLGKEKVRANINEVERYAGKNLSIQQVDRNRSKAARLNKNAHGIGK